MKIINDFVDFENFEDNKLIIKRNLRLLLDKSEEIRGSFPSQKVKKNTNLSTECSYQNNIFKRISPLFRSFISENSQNDVKSPIKREETLFLKENSNENVDFLVGNDEFNTLERKKIDAFDMNYSFENNTNNISNSNQKLNKKIIDRDKIDKKFNGNSNEKINEKLDNSLNNRDSFLSFIDPNPHNLSNSSFSLNKSLQNSQPLSKTPEEDSFRLRSSNELKDIKHQMKALESNLNSILAKLNQQILTSKFSLAQNENLEKTIEKKLRENPLKSVDKKVIIIQKNKESLINSESPLKARIDPKTQGFSKNISPFCKELLEKNNIMKKFDEKSWGSIDKNGNFVINSIEKSGISVINSDEFGILNNFKNYEEIIEKGEITDKKTNLMQNNVNINIQNHFDVITKDVMNMRENSRKTDGINEKKLSQVHRSSSFVKFERGSEEIDLESRYKWNFETNYNEKKGEKYEINDNRSKFH